MAFTLDREGAAARLGVSSRTIDRHIQAGRIRTRRIGKKMFLEDEDIEALRNMDPARRQDDYVIVMEDEVMTTPIISKKETITYEAQAITELVRLYEETRGIIAKKDETIQELSYRLGQAETELKSSVPLIDYNKATFLLESAKSRGDQDASMLNQKVESLEKEIIKRNGAILSLALLFVLVLSFSVVFFFFSPQFL